MLEMISTMKEVTALAVALGCLVYLLTRYIPQKEERFNTSFLAQAAMFKEDLALVVEANKVDRREVLAAMGKLTDAIDKLERCMARRNSTA